LLAACRRPKRRSVAARVVRVELLVREVETAVAIGCIGPGVANEVELRGDVGVAADAGISHRRDFRRSPLGDACAVGAQLEQEELPVSGLGRETFVAFDHRLGGQVLDNGTDRVDTACRVLGNGDGFGCLGFTEHVGNTESGDAFPVTDAGEILGGDIEQFAARGARTARAARTAHAAAAAHAARARAHGAHARCAGVRRAARRRARARARRGASGAGGAAGCASVGRGADRGAARYRGHRGSGTRRGAGGAGHRGGGGRSCGRAAEVVGRVVAAVR